MSRLSGIRRVQFLRALSHRNFLYLWVSTTIYGLTYTMNNITQSWLVLELTDSAFLLGVVNLARFLPLWFLGLVGGIAADRINRRNILVAIQTANVACTLALAFLVSTGVAQIWHIILIAFVMGCFHAFNGPARTTLIVDIVGADDLYNATSFIMMTEDITNSLGFFFGGALIQFLGIGGSYFSMAVIFGFTTLILFLIRGVKRPPVAKGRSAVRDLVDGLKYIRSKPILIGLLAVATYWNLFISINGFRATLVPIFGREVMNIGAASLGVLMGASGLGELFGLLCVAVLLQFRPNFKHKGWLLTFSAMGLGTCIMTFAMVRWYPLNFALWFLMGAMSDIHGAVQNTLLVLNSSEDMRGRVMGARAQVICVLPIGSYWAGAVAQMIGAPLTLIIGGGLWTLAVLVTVVLVRDLWKSE